MSAIQQSMINLSINDFAKLIAKQECIVPMLQTNQAYINELANLIETVINKTKASYVINKPHHTQSEKCSCKLCDSIHDWLYDNYQYDFIKLFSGGITSQNYNGLEDDVEIYLEDSFQDVEKYIRNYVMNSQ